MKLIDYKDYCNKVFLTEEKLKDVVERLKVAFPDESEFKVYTSILDLFPSLSAKSIVASVLIRTEYERTGANISPEQTKEVFEHLLELLKRNIKIDLAGMLKKDRTEHPEIFSSHLFRQLTELVHYQTGRIQALVQKKIQKKYAVGDLAQEVDTKFPDPIYIDDNFEVYEAKSPAECKAYIGNSTICLKYPEHFWGTYRIPYASAVYYVFPKTPKNDYIKDNKRHKFLQIELRSAGDLVWTWEDNLMHNLGSLSELKGMFPELTSLIDKGVFKIRPHAPGEVENFRKVQQVLDDDSFRHLGYEVRTMYISNGHQLTDGQWTMIDKNQKNAYINFSVHRDVTNHQFEDIKKDLALYKRYLTIKKRGLEEKIKSREFIRDGATPHESIVLPELLSSVSESTRRNIIDGLVANIKDVLAGRISPKTDIFGIYELFKGQLLADPAMNTDEVLKSITNIIAGGKSLDWVNVPNNVKEGIYKIADDIYQANSAKMKPLIDNIIKNNPKMLLQGLITVPTQFQVKYFNEHKKELFSNKEFLETFNNSILGNLVYGTLMPDWLRQYWNENKKEYSKNKEFSDTIKYDLQKSIFGTINRKFSSYDTLPKETKEVYDAYIDEIWDDPKTIDIVGKSYYDLIMTKKAEPNKPDSWNVSDDFKSFFKEHVNQLETWLAFKLIDVTPEKIEPGLPEIINRYKDKVFNSPTYRDQIEKRLVNDIIFNEDLIFPWSGERINYWNKNFWEILSRNENSEKALVKKVIEEYGRDSNANAFYSENYIIPLSFYKKHEKEILSDPAAYEGLKKKVIFELVWRRGDNNTTDKQAINNLSPIERDFYENHKKEFPKDVISIKNRGQV